MTHDYLTGYCSRELKDCKKQEVGDEVSDTIAENCVPQQPNLLG